MARVSEEEYKQLRRNLGLPAEPEEQPGIPRKNKYNARKVYLDGYTFDSKAEAKYYIEKKWELCGGLISDLWVHTRFPLVVGDKLICTYESDVDFVDVKKKEWVVVDVKSEKTRKLPVYQRNKKLMKELLGIDIREVVR